MPALIQISDLSNILKKVIAPAIQRQLFTETVLLSKIKKNSGVIRLGNNEWFVTMQSGHHSGIYAVGENVQIRKGKAKYSQAKVAAKYVFGSFELTDQAIEAAQDDKGAIATVLNENAKTAKEDLRKELNRMFHGWGNGQICLANGAGTATTTVVVDTPGTEYVREGGFVKIGPNAAVEVVSVDSATQFTIASAQTWADNAVITRDAADEPMGLAGIIDDGTNVATIQNIARSTNPWAKSFVDDTAEALSEDDMINAYLEAKKYGRPMVAMMNKTLFKKYGNLLTSMKKTADLKEVLSGGWKGLEFMGGDVGVILDYDTPDGYVQFVDFESLTITELTPVSWLDRGAGILTKIPDYAKWEGTLRWYGNLAVKNFRANTRLRQKTA